MKTTRIVSFAILLTFFAAFSAMAGEWGEIRAASVNLNVREARSPKSAHVLTLTKGEQVRVDFARDGWIAVFDLKETVRDEKRALGYANAKYLVDVPESANVVKTPANQPEAAPEPEGEGELTAAVAVEPPAAVKPLGADPKKAPVKITADRMTYDEKNKVVSFVGNVKARHGKLILDADRLSAFFSSANDKAFSVDSVDRIVANGNVRARKDNTEGSCETVTYHVEKQLLRMEGNPVLKDGPNSIAGEVINFYVRENRSEVVGGSKKRVEAIFLTPKIKVD